MAAPKANALRTVHVRLEAETLKVEVANTLELQQKGLMNRATLDSGAGMLFFYKQEQVVEFWMKNTRIPLSIGFFDKNSRLLQTIKMPLDPKGMTDETRKRYRSAKRVKMALEVPFGWFERKKIKLGTKLVIEQKKD